MMPIGRLLALMITVFGGAALLLWALAIAVGIL